MSCRFLTLIPRVFRPSPPFLSFSPALPSLRLLRSSYPFLVSTRSLCHQVTVSSLPSLSTNDDELHGDGGGESAAARVLTEAIERTVEDKEGGESAAARALPEAPKLTGKEKKELLSYAHTLGDKLKTQQIGKSGVTPNVFLAINETIEANELIKVKIHRSCSGDMDEIVDQLKQGTGSVAVSQIGRVVILYRPSMSKLKAVEKKKEARLLFLQKKRKVSTTAPRE